ncbi:hypothetical protein J4558_19670 [Leptolyngbya sp. 15MV]|nr:hypothetical protein J4558_19670 [Leptolyngbya sp. 15MV]
MQVLVPRAIAPAEIQRVRHVPRFIGWRRSAFARLAPIPPPPGAAERRRRRRLAEAALARLAAEHPPLWRRLAAAGLAEDQAWRQAWGGEFADTDDSRRSEVIADLTWTLDEMEAEAAGLPPPARED